MSANVRRSGLAPQGTRKHKQLHYTTLSEEIPGVVSEVMSVWCEWSTAEDKAVYQTSRKIQFGDVIDLLFSILAMPQM